MPVAVELNGLLPGRGPGRGACRWPGAEGRGPAAAAGRSASVLSAAGRSIVSAGGTCGPWLWSCGNGTVTAAADRAGGAAGSGADGGSGAGAAGAAGAAGVAAFAGGALPLPFALAAAVLAALAACGFADCCVAKASFSLRTTGASIVEDAERTNSPISLSLAITALLSTPNSLASSYTRTFATTLPLLGPAIRAISRSGQRVLRPASACAVHRRMLIGRSSQISAFFRSHQPTATANCRSAARASRRLPPGIPRPCHPAARPGGEVPASKPCGAGLVPSMPGSGAGMHPGQVAARQRRERSRLRRRPSGSARAWRRGHRIRYSSGWGSALPVSAYRACASSAPGTLPASSSSGRADAATGAASAVSARISMRQPVSRAARRTFCPSFPIASESW